MAKSKVSKRLVIDASVARSSGGENAIHPTSMYCRRLLLAVLEICHQLVLTDDIRQEWDAHQSKFAMQWRRQMVTKRKVVFLREPIDNQKLRNELAKCGTSQEADAMLKDCLLLEAALSQDRVVISLDEVVHRLFANACGQVGELRDIIWANPNDSTLLAWLENGAEPDEKRKLRNYIP